MNTSAIIILLVGDNPDLNVRQVVARASQLFEGEFALKVQSASVNNRDVDKYAKRTAFYASLTERQRQIVRCVVCGLSNKEIAVELSIVPGVVAEYLSVIYVRLDYFTCTDRAPHSNRARLIRYFGDFFEQL